ncbi:DUF4440 domain-containing protein [Streptomyces sp. NPDC048664]|uniref:nuclear transport factor 2 family protein n=1 Tax=Streptomyces sp. NPDC048664 TaxID=3154505 RepID=UPI003424F40B
MDDERGRGAVDAAIDAELRLLDPEVRASPAAVRELLDPEFVEFGASGRRWDAESILTVTGSGSVSSHSPVSVDAMTGTVLAPGVVHLTYLLDHDGRRAWRSSLWRWSETGWRLYFHQATPTDRPRP